MTIKEDKFKETDKEQVNKILKEFAEPLMKLGIQVAVAYLGK